MVGPFLFLIHDYIVSGLSLLDCLFLLLINCLMKFLQVRFFHLPDEIERTSSVGRWSFLHTDYWKNMDRHKNL